SGIPCFDVPLYAVSMDQVQTFSPSTSAQTNPPPWLTSAGDVTTAAGNGNVFVGWTNYGTCAADGGTCPGDIMLMQAPAGTTNFSVPVAADSYPALDRVDRPWVSVSPTGSLFLDYVDLSLKDNNGFFGQYVIRQSADGITFQHFVWVMAASRTGY